MDGVLLVDLWRERRSKAFVLELIARSDSTVEFARELHRTINSESRDFLKPEPGENPRWLILPGAMLRALALAQQLGLTVEVVHGEAEKELDRLVKRVKQGRGPRKRRGPQANPGGSGTPPGAGWGPSVEEVFRTVWEAAQRVLPGAAAVAGPPLDPDFVVLHLLPSAPEEVAKAAYRALSLSMHPDRPGGDAEAMKRLNAAYDAIRAKRGWAA